MFELFRNIFKFVTDKSYNFALYAYRKEKYYAEKQVESLKEANDIYAKRITYNRAKINKLEGEYTKEQCL